jgi:hypothetical protein
MLALLALSPAACTHIEAERPREQALRERKVAALSPRAEQWVRSWDACLSEQTEEAQRERVRLALTLLQTPALQRQVAGLVTVNVATASVSPDVLAALGRSTDGETLLLAARWYAEILKDPARALPLVCRASDLVPGSYRAQVLCGDFLESERQDSREAVKHWRAAYPLASSREEQCHVLDALAARSLDPEQDLKGISAAVIAKCAEEQKRRQEQADLGQLRVVQEKLLLAVEKLSKQLEQAGPARGVPEENRR